jgi:retron-type reverse transcriptase
MKRIANLWPLVTSFDNLLTAARRASRGKRNRASVARFLERVELEVLDIQTRLRSGAWQPGAMTRFTIHDPKERVISVASFGDRVVHHALIDVLEPFFDRRMVYESFACRRGKGTHAAIRHAQHQTRKQSWFLKLDVRKCFESLVHEVVHETLARIIKDRAVLDLSGKIVRAGGTGAGLPIGSLTSQWFANLVLDRLDHHVKEKLRVPGYARYMDDFVLFGNDKHFLQDAREEVTRYVGQTLRLEIKERATILAPVREGLPFLGWRIYPGIVRLRPGNRKRSYHRLKQRLWEYRQGWLTEDELADCVRSVLAHVDRRETHGLRQRWIRDLAPRSPT